MWFNVTILLLHIFCNKLNNMDYSTGTVATDYLNGTTRSCGIVITLHYTYTQLEANFLYSLREIVVTYFCNVDSTI